MTDPQTLLDQAKCYMCLGVTLAEALELALLAQIVSGGSSASIAQVISTTAADPNAAGIVPSDPTKGAIFYQDTNITLFNEWRWSVQAQTWKQTIAP